jgi:hypothetical protein
LFFTDDEGEGTDQYASSIPTQLRTTIGNHARRCWHQQQQQTKEAATSSSRSSSSSSRHGAGVAGAAVGAAVGAMAGGVGGVGGVGGMDENADESTERFTERFIAGSREGVTLNGQPLYTRDFSPFFFKPALLQICDGFDKRCVSATKYVVVLVAVRSTLWSMLWSMLWS